MIKHIENSYVSPHAVSYRDSVVSNVRLPQYSNFYMITFFVFCFFLPINGGLLGYIS